MWPPSLMRSMKAGSGSVVSCSDPVSSDACAGSRRRGRGGGGPAGPVAARIEAGMPSIMPGAVACAGTAGAAGVGATLWARGRISAREAATTPATRRRVGTRATGSAPPSRDRMRSAPSTRTWPWPRERLAEPPADRSTTASAGGSPSNAFSRRARTSSVTEPVAVRERDTTAQISSSTSSSCGSVTRTQWSPAPSRTPSPAAYLVSTTTSLSSRGASAIRTSTIVSSPGAPACRLCRTCPSRALYLGSILRRRGTGSFSR